MVHRAARAMQREKRSRSKRWLTLQECMLSPPPKSAGRINPRRFKNAESNRDRPQVQKCPRSHGGGKGRCPDCVRQSICWLRRGCALHLWIRNRSSLCVCVDTAFRRSSFGFSARGALDRRQESAFRSREGLGGNSRQVVT